MSIWLNEFSLFERPLYNIHSSRVVGILLSKISFSLTQLSRNPPSSVLSILTSLLRKFFAPSKSRVEGEDQARGKHFFSLKKQDKERSHLDWIWASGFLISWSWDFEFAPLRGLPSRNCDGLGFPMGVFLFFLCVVTYDSLMAKRRKEYCEGSRKFRKKP